MQNLSADNLGKMVQLGGGSGLSSSAPDSLVSENRVQNEMKKEGLQTSAASESGKNFFDILRDSVIHVNLNQQQADTAVKELIAGRNKNIHETMLTLEKADISLKLMMQVRNKILDAYREIMHMPL